MDGWIITSKFYFFTHYSQELQSHQISDGYYEIILHYCLVRNMEVFGENMSAHVKLKRRVEQIKYRELLWMSWHTINEA